MPVPNAPTVLSGASMALFLGNPSVEVPMSKGEIKITGKKTEATGSTSTGQPVAAGGTTRIWEEFGAGAAGWTFNWEGHWRVGQVVTPPSVLVLETYKMIGYVRRPGWNNIVDAGEGWRGNLFIEDNSMTMDPKSGTVDWKVSGTGNGPLSYS